MSNLSWKEKWEIITKSLKKVCKSKARASFLQNCHKFEICPPTLKIKPPKNSNPKLLEQFENVSKMASIHNLQIAMHDERRIANSLETAHNNLIDELNLNEKSQNSMEHLSKEIFDQINKTYVTKLNNLKIKNNIPITTPRVPGLPKKKGKTRRFLPLRKYVKMKKVESTKRNLDLVHNFSDFVLTAPMISLLNRGPSFVPTTKNVNISQIQAELDRYERSMLWSEYYFERKEDEEIVTKLKNEGDQPICETKVFQPIKTNLPKSSAPNSLNVYLGAVRSDILGSCRKPSKVHDNLSSAEQQAMKELAIAQADGQIQIKLVDKGGGIAIMNLKDYLIEVSDHVNAKFTNQDSTTSFFYEEVSKDTLDQQKAIVHEAIKKGYDLNLISKSDQKFMEPSGKPNRFYLIPKVHKGIKENRNIPPCRPIVSNSGANTENISALVDFYSKHLVKYLDSYVEDSPDLLRKFDTENKKGPQTLNTFPVTIDVNSLYTSIPADGISGGLQAFEKALNTRSKDEKTAMPTEYLMELLELVLKGNIFEIGEKYYVQRIGTAMGTKVAPTYACLFMGWLEKEFLGNVWNGTQPIMWRRFIDDIFFLWSSTVNDLEKFIKNLNGFHSHIKFTATYDQEKKSVPFLDMQVSIDKDGFIQTDLFKKDTARCQYLLPSSCHPGHITKNIPFSLANRLLRICSNPDDFAKRLEELKNDLISRQYSPKIIYEAFEKVKKIKREDALKKVSKLKTNTSNNILVTTYHPALPSVTNTVKKHHKVMTDENSRLKRCFPKPSLVAYKRSKNIKDILVRAKVCNKRKSNRKINGFFGCKRKVWEKCMLCVLIPEAGLKTHKCHKTKEIFNINSVVTCTTKNVIYKISCRRCPEFVYIGETGRRFCDRFADHRGYVTRMEIEKAIGEHFNKARHKCSDMIPSIIEQVQPLGNNFLRMRREKYWINKYQAVDFGANRRF